MTFAALLNMDNPLTATLNCNSVEAFKVIELPRQEYLLVFGTLAAYVDGLGRRSRDREIMYPAVPTALCNFTRPLLKQTLNIIFCRLS